MITALQEKVLIAYQSPVNSAKDCVLLANTILTATGRNISETTIRRFFGLLKSKSHLSQYNLDTLAFYCGYPDYTQFSRSLGTNNKHHKLTDELNKITRYSLNSIKKRSLTPYEQTIPRNEVNGNLDQFLASQEPAYILLAPGGYGKSTAMAHWVSLGIEEGQPIIFIQAAILLNYINEANRTTALSFDLNNKTNVFASWQGIYPQTPLIMVIDGWEEIRNNSKKQDQLLDYITQVILLYEKVIPLKIILSLRATTWEQLLLDQPSGKQKKEGVAFKKNTSHILPPFSNEEIRMAIDKFNIGVKDPIIYEHILWDLLEMIKVPFNLYLYTKLYAKFPEHESIGHNRLLEFYFKEKVFESKYAEEKEDILWTLIAFISDTNFIFINKKDLKQQHPIHIKRESNYYNAYTDLLADSILEEERIVNKYGLYSTIVQFKHQNYLYYLTALNMIRQNNGLSGQLFKNVVWSSNFWSWKASIVAILFEIAYNNEDFEAIKDFCELPDSIHDSLQVRFTVGKAFRYNNHIRDKVIKQFASSNKGQSYYFEQFVDTNYLYNNYVFRVKEYLKSKSTNEAILFGNSILFLAGFLKLNKQECLQYKVLVDSIEINANIHPWLIGRKVATTLMQLGFIVGGKLVKSLKAITQLREFANAYDGYFKQGLITFELPILVPLVFLRQFEALEELLLDSIKKTESTTIKHDFVTLLSQNQNVLPGLVLEYAKFKQGKKYDEEFNLKIESSLNNLSNSYDDFQYQIMLRWILFDYYTHLGKTGKAKYQHAAALQLSEFAGYDFFVLFLKVNALGVTKIRQESLLEEIKNQGFIAKAFLAD